MFKVNEEIKFTVEQDGETCELVHAFRPATPSEWLEEHRALLEYGKAGEEDIEAGIHLASARFELWAKLIQEVRGYADEHGRPLQIGDTLIGVPPEHQLRAIGMWLKKKAPKEPSDPDSGRKPGNGSKENGSGAPAPEETDA